MTRHILEEWRFRDVEQKADRANSRLYEIYSLRSDVDRLERAVRDLSAVVDGLRNELQANQDKTRELQDWIDAFKWSVQDGTFAVRA